MAKTRRCNDRIRIHQSRASGAVHLLRYGGIHSYCNASNLVATPNICVVAVLNRSPPAPRSPDRASLLQADPDYWNTDGCCMYSIQNCMYTYIYDVCISTYILYKYMYA